MKIIISILFTMTLNSLFSQITIHNTQTPAQLVQNILLGNGILTSNIKYNGSIVDALSVQYNVSSFSALGTNFPINDGLLLTTGYAHVAVGPNNNIINDTYNGTILDDPDLDSLSTASIANGAVIEFDFQATSDTFSFKYIFASEEYNEFVGWPYNDVFGFFLSGPGISGPFSNNGFNLAVLPTTNTNSNVVSINNVNNGNSTNLPLGTTTPITASNSTYYVNNEQSQAYGNAIQYDGTTVLMSSGTKLICGQTYHIKLGIASVIDQAYPSAVFIKSKSFSSENISFNMPNNFNGTVLEDCSLGSHLITITRPSSQSNNALTLNLSYTGSAINGVDYQSLPSSLTFLANQDSISIPINIINDNIVEGVENIVLTTSYTNNCGTLITFTDTLFISDNIPVNISTNDYTYYCPNFNSHVTVLSGMAPYTYSWFDNSTNDSISISNSLPNQINNFVVTVTDACDNSDTDTSIITYLPVISDFNPNQFVSAINSTITFSNLSQNATNFMWNFGNGLSSNTNSSSNQSSFYSNTGVYTIELIASNGLCKDTSYRIITIGGNPLIEPSNVFTPNGDGVNDEFQFNLELVKSLDLTILNRWGNVIFEVSNQNPKWNGKDLNGNDLNDGVYFYTYTAYGYIGEPLKGSGYLHLIRN